MDQKFSVVCEERVATEIESLARENGLSREEVIRQLIDLGLESVDERET
jgi:2-iminoacetate synthase ThiH